MIYFSAALECLSKGDSIRVEVGEDGPSLPILILTVKVGRSINMIMLGQEHMDELMAVLEHAKKEMQ